ncbi:MAG: nuclear transport factor 2 family protein, partial [Clostridium sp.]
MKKLIKQFWNDVVFQNKDKLRKYFCEDAIIRWHCTNESFNVDEYIIANCEYPGTWSGEVERFIQVGNTIITVTRVFSEDISCHVTSFFTLYNNK